MASTVEETSLLLENLKLNFSGGAYNDCKKSMGLLKLKLTEMSYLPPREFRKTQKAKREILLAREILEFAVLTSLKLEDDAAFERNFLQLKPYYTDYRGRIPKSPSESLIFGVNLLRLLVQNRIAEFHTELELLPSETLSDQYVKHVVELEQALMEGAYNRILNEQYHVPDPYYNHFMTLLSKTVRNEIAACSEKSYESLTFSAAKKLLAISTDEELAAFADEHGWELSDNVVTFAKEEKGAVREEIPAMKIIHQALGYARELERIV